MMCELHETTDGLAWVCECGRRLEKRFFARKPVAQCLAFHPIDQAYQLAEPSSSAPSPRAKRAKYLGSPEAMRSEDEILEVINNHCRVCPSFNSAGNLSAMKCAQMAGCQCLGKHLASKLHGCPDSMAPKFGPDQVAIAAYRAIE